jgi:hypothetical protein
MPFDPTFPIDNSAVAAPEMRAQLNALKGLIDALAQRVSDLENPPSLPGLAELSLEAPSSPHRAAFTLSATDAATFNVWHRLLGAPDFTLLADNVPPGLYETPDLAPGDYEFKAEGVNAAGIGPESGIAAVTVT